MAKCFSHPNIELLKVFPEEPEGTECMVCIHEENERYDNPPPPLWHDDSSYAAYQAYDPYADWQPVSLFKYRKPVSLVKAYVPINEPPF